MTMQCNWYIFTLTIFFIDIKETATLLSRVDVSDDEQALCLDGTRYAYGLRPVIATSSRLHVARIPLKLATVLCRAMAEGNIGGSYTCREGPGALPRLNV